jgi:phosphoglycerate dehydrogenase-like enzyme
MSLTTFTAKLSKRHQQNLMNRFPELTFSFFDQIDDAMQKLPQTEILVTYGEDLTEEIIADHCPSLKWIHVISAGLEKMPFSIIAERRILVTNAKGIHQIPMAEYTIGVMLQITRQMNEIFLNQRDGIWDRSIRVDELSGKTIGIVGVGAIGGKIAEYAKVMGMRVIGTNRSGQPVPHVDVLYPMNELDRLMKESDFIVVIVPHTPETEQMIGEAQLSRMKATAYLINIARGSIVDEEALVKLLQERKIGGAVLDVFTQEPLPSDHPFWTLGNVILTPHLSGRSPKYMERALDIFYENIPVYLSGQGEMRNKIDPYKGY